MGDDIFEYPEPAKSKRKSHNDVKTPEEKWSSGKRRGDSRRGSSGYGLQKKKKSSSVKSAIDRSNTIANTDMFRKIISSKQQHNDFNFSKDSTPPRSNKKPSKYKPLECEQRGKSAATPVNRPGSSLFSNSKKSTERVRSGFEQGIMAASKARKTLVPSRPKYSQQKSSGSSSSRLKGVRSSAMRQSYSRAPSTTPTAKSKPKVEAPVDLCSSDSDDPEESTAQLSAPLTFPTNSIRIGSQNFKAEASLWSDNIKLSPKSEPTLEIPLDDITEWAMLKAKRHAEVSSCIAFKTKNDITIKPYEAYYSPNDADFKKTHILILMNDQTKFLEICSDIAKVLSSNGVPARNMSVAEAKRYITVVEQEPLLKPKKRSSSILPPISPFKPPKSLEKTPTASQLIPQRRSQRLQTRQHFTTVDLSRDDDMEIVLEYPLPPETSDIIRISKGDIRRLLPLQYLNDNIVDYYMRVIMLNLKDRCGDDVRNKYLSLTSHFYTKLTERGSVAENGYQQVARWSTTKEIFSNEVVFIPINKDLHWSIAIICNPRGAATNSTDYPTMILLLDSLGNYHKKTRIAKSLKEFLSLEWENKGDKNLTYDADRIQVVHPKVPCQANGSDCGVFMLEYAEIFTQTYNERLGSDDADNLCESIFTPQLFGPDEIVKKRRMIKKQLKDLSVQYANLIANGVPEQEEAGGSESEKEAEESIIPTENGAERKEEDTQVKRKKKKPKAASDLDDFLLTAIGRFIGTKKAAMDVCSVADLYNDFCNTTSHEKSGLNTDRFREYLTVAITDHPEIQFDIMTDAIQKSQSE